MSCRYISTGGYGSRWNNVDGKHCQLVQFEDCGRKELRGESRSRRLRRRTRFVEGRKQSVRKDRNVSLQSAQERSAHGNAHFHFGERPQRGCENGCVPAGSPIDDRASGALWPYRRHARNYPGDVDAVPAFATSDVVDCCLFKLCGLTRRLRDNRWRL